MQMQITIPVEISGIIEQLAQELPALIKSGETWAIEINGAKDGRIFRQVKRSTQIDAGPLDKRRLIRRAEPGR